MKGVTLTKAGRGFCFVFTPKAIRAMNRYIKRETIFSKIKFRTHGKNIRKSRGQ